MKKLFLLFVFFSSFVLGQKAVHFDYEVEYEFVNEPSYMENVHLQLLVSLKQGVLLLSSYNDNELRCTEKSEFLIHQGNIYQVGTLLGKIIFYKPNYYQIKNNFFSFKNVFERLTSLHITEKINSIDSEKFTISPDENVWIAKNHTVDMLNILKPKKSTSKINGLITKYGFNNTDTSFIIKSYRKINLNINFDLKKEIKKYNKEVARLEKEYNQRKKEKDKAIEDAKKAGLEVVERVKKAASEVVMDAVENEKIVQPKRNN
ncbi:MAG: hypothetical protein CSA38_02890 [Flavobacteriales bacterium]|nr:MAG: hypothetical protein CSA38_02890 [Flavobacteriales bacterium]